jgi:hypothetical protein
MVYRYFPNFHGVDRAAADTCLIKLMQAFDHRPTFAKGAKKPMNVGSWNGTL